MSDTLNTIRYALNHYAYPMPTIENAVSKLERELNESNDLNRVMRREIKLLEERNEELQWQVDGYTKCESCNGECGHYEGSVGRLGSPVDPQTWVNCDACRGDGWVQL